MIKTTGIIFRQTRFKESSLILDIYTEEAGLQSFISNGVFSKSNQKLASTLQLMNIIDLVAYYREDKDLHRIKEVSRTIIYQNLPFDIRRSAIGMFLLEICRKCIRSHQQNSSLFLFIKNAFVDLDQKEPFDPNFHICFMINLMSYLGFQPQNNYSDEFSCFDLANGVFSSASSETLYHLSNESSKIFSGLLSGLPSHTLFHNSQQRRQMIQALVIYFQLHIENFGKIRSLDVFHEIL